MGYYKGKTGNFFNGITTHKFPYKQRWLYYNVFHWDSFYETVGNTRTPPTCTLCYYLLFCRYFLHRYNLYSRSRYRFDILKAPNIVVDCCGMVLDFSPLKISYNHHLRNWNTYNYYEIHLLKRFYNHIYETNCVIL